MENNSGEKHTVEQDEVNDQFLKSTFSSFKAHQDLIAKLFGGIIFYSTIALYLSGITYHHRILSHFSLPSDLFLKDTHSTIKGGFTIITGFLFNTYIVPFFMAIFALILLIHLLHSHYCFKKKYSVYKSVCDKAPTFKHQSLLPPLPYKAKIFKSKVYLLLYSAFGMLFLIYMPYLYGELRARKEIEKEVKKFIEAPTKHKHYCRITDDKGKVL